MKKSRIISLLLVLVLLSSVIVGCSSDTGKEAGGTDADVTEDGKGDGSEDNEDKEISEEDKKGGTLVAAIGREPQTFNPDAISDDGAYPIIQNTFNKLVKINFDEKIVPDLAKSWDYTDDGKTLTFHLHEDVKWHDGEKFSAEDVVWTFNEIFEKEGFAASQLGGIDSVEALDENTVVMKLKESDAGLMGYIAWFGTYIMPKHIYEGTDWLKNEANQKPIGTGPFKFVEHISGDKVVVERNDDFFGKVPYLEKIVYRIMPDSQTQYQAWLNGEVDIISSGVPQEEIADYKNNPEYNITEKFWPNKSYLLFNVREGKFTDKNLREAIAYGIDSPELNKKALKDSGSISEYFISPLYDWAINEDVKTPTRDVEKAIGLIEKAGYEKDKDGFYFETTIDTFPGWDAVTEVLKEQFKEIGIDLKVNAMDDPAYDEKVWFGGDFELTVLGGYQGPDISAMGARISTGASLNKGFYSNEKVDQLLKEGAMLTEESERAVKYKEIQEILKEDMPFVYFNDKGAKIVVKSNVHGHPAVDARENSSESEYTHIWLEDK